MRTIDFTFVTGMVAVGNYVFMDVNGNGTYEMGTDMPIENVSLELYAAGDTPGVDALRQVQQVPMPMVTTTLITWHQATTLCTSRRSNFAAGQPLEDKESYAGADATDNTDGNDNGIDDANPLMNGIALQIPSRWHPIQSQRAKIRATIQVHWMMIM
jgi:hypothetical protein